MKLNTYRYNGGSRGIRSARLAKNAKKKLPVDNKKLFQAIKKYHAGESKELPEVAVENIYTLCTNLTNSQIFKHLPFKEDMIADAVLNCVQAVEEFDPDVSTNPFGYLSRVAYNSCTRSLVKYIRGRVAIDRYATQQQF